MRDSDELASAFVELEALVRDSSRLPGLAAAQVEARRRRANRAAWVASALVLLVLAGVATLVPGWLRRSGPPVLEPSPSVTTDPTPTPSPSGTISPPPGVLANITAPEQLRDATLDVPAFDLVGCPSGRLQFRDGISGEVQLESLMIEVAAVGDVDADGLEDTVLAVRCSVPDGTHGAHAVQVIAYSGPGLTLRGPVASAAGGMEVASLLVSPNGEVQVGLAQASSPRVQVLAMAFDRYQWTGSGFDQIEHVDVPNAALPVMVVGAEPASVQLAPGAPALPVVLTVRNEGPTWAWPLRLNVGSFAAISIDVEEAAGPGPGPQQSLLIAVPPPGETVRIALQIALPAGVMLPPDASIVAQVFGQRSGEDASGTFTISLLPA